MLSWKTKFPGSSLEDKVSEEFFKVWSGGRGGKWIFLSQCVAIRTARKGRLRKTKPWHVQGAVAGGGWGWSEMVFKKHRFTGVWWWINYECWFYQGIMKSPILKAIKKCQCMIIFGDCPFNSALLGLVMVYRYRRDEMDVYNTIN